MNSYSKPVVKEVLFRVAHPIKLQNLKDLFTVSGSLLSTVAKLEDKCLMSKPTGQRCLPLSGLQASHVTVRIVDFMHVALLRDQQALL